MNLYKKTLISVLGVFLLLTLSPFTSYAMMDIYRNIESGFIEVAQSLRVTGNAVITGNFGIGTPTPSKQLDIYNDTTSELRLATLSGGSVSLSQTSNGVSLMTTSSNNGGNLILGTAGTEKVRLDTTGNVGIATSTPTERLEVNGNIRFSGSTPAFRVGNMADPVDNADAANKKYVDTRVSANGGGGTAGGAYLNNGEYYSVGGDPFYCKMFKLGDSQQFIKAINYRKPCDIAGGKFCNKNAECSSTLDTMIFSPGQYSLHKCIIYGNAALCHGYNGYGQLGDSTGTNRTSPTKVSFLDKPVDIQTGRTMTCAVEDEGSVKCWGQQYWGLGNGGTSSSYPVKVNNITNASKVVLNHNYAPGSITQGSDTTYSRYDSQCALLKDGGVKCWGNGAVGQLGYGSFGNSSSPVSVSLGGTATKLFASGYFSASSWTVPSGPSSSYNELGEAYYCVIMTDTTVKCWGNNRYGMLGDGSTTSQSTPVSVKLNSTTSLSGVVDLALTSDHACAVLNSGGVKCWGKNTNGYLGNGTNSNSSYAVDVKLNSTTNLSSVKQVISVPNWHDYSDYAINLNGPSYGIHMTTCAVTTTGYVYCWGFGTNGGIGNNTTTQDNLYATATSDVYGTIKLTASIGFHQNYGSTFCALISEGGKVKCWGGYNQYGQIGDGTQNNWRNSPVLVSNLDGATDIFGGVSSVCAVINSEFKCWGQNNYGQLGVGNSNVQLTPQTVKNLPDNFAIYGSDSAEKNMGSSGAYPTFCLSKNRYNGNLGGEEGANSICTAECGAGFKFADEGDMTNFAGISTAAGSWIGTKVNGSTEYNCSNWTIGSYSNPSTGGTIFGGYLSVSTSGYSSWSLTTQTCNNTFRIACVKGIR